MRPAQARLTAWSRDFDDSAMKTSTSRRGTVLQRYKYSSALFERHQTVPLGGGTGRRGRIDLRLEARKNLDQKARLFERSEFARSPKF